MGPRASIPKGPPLPQKNFFKNSVGQILGPLQRWAPHALLLRHCAVSSDKMRSGEMRWDEIYKRSSMLSHRSHCSWRIQSSAIINSCMDCAKKQGLVLAFYRLLKWPCNAIGRLCLCVCVPTMTWDQNDIRRIDIYFAPGKGAKYCDEYASLSVCLSVCPSTRISRKLHGRTAPNFCACCLWPRLGLAVMVLRYAKYFRLCG